MFKDFAQKGAVANVKGKRKKEIVAELEATLVRANDPDGDSGRLLNAWLGGKAAVATGKCTMERVEITYDGTEPIFWRERDGLFTPTVYGLWQVPRLLPRVIVIPNAVSFLAKGADLMAPGLSSSESLDGLLVGDVVAVVPLGMQAIGVGRLAMDARQLEASGRKGKVVRMVHTVGDALWEAGSRRQPGADPLWTHRASAAAEDDASSDEASSERSEAESGRSEGKGKERAEETPSDPMCGYTMEELFKYVLVCCLRRIKDKELPMLVSTFTTQTLRAWRPPGTTLDVKQTSWKKMGAFFEAMHKEHLVRVKELSKGVASIVDINRRHDWFSDFRPDRRLPVGPNNVAPAAGATAAVQRIRVEELYAPLKHIRPIFRELGETRSEPLYSKASLQQFLTQACSARGLLDGNKVRVDALQQKVAGARAAGDGTVSMEELVECYMANGLKPTQAIIHPGDRVILKKGASLEKMRISTARVRNNKLLTTLTGADVIGFDVEELARDFQKRFASSTTVTAAESKTSKQAIDIQGDVVDRLVASLVKDYGVPKDLIDAPSKKKKGKGKK